MSSISHHALLGSRTLHAVAGLLLLAPALAGQIHKLNGPLPREILGDVQAFRVSRDGARVVYLANQASAAPSLYVVPSDGSRAPLELTSGQVERITSFELAAGDAAVVYLDGELRCASTVAGTAPRVLNAPLAPGERVADFRLAPAGDWVAYRVSGLPGEDRLYSVRLDGLRDARQLDRSVGRGVLPYQITPDGTRVVYSTGVALCAVPLIGGLRPVQLNAGHPSHNRITEFRIGSDPERVVYRADQGQENVFELYAAPLDGRCPPVRLNAPLPSGGDVQGDFELAALGRVVYRADQRSDDSFELYAAPLDGSLPPITLSGALAPAGDVFSFRLAPDGSALVYLADESVSDVSRLYLTAIDRASSPTALGTTLPLPRYVYDYEISPSGERVVYRARLAVGFGLGLYASSFSDPEAAVPLAEGFTIHDFHVGPDGQRVAFAHYGTDERGVASVPCDGTAPPTELATELPIEFRVTPDGRRLLFVADLIEREANELFSVPLEGGAAPLRLNGALFAGRVIGDVDSFRFGPGGMLVFKVSGSTLDPPIVADRAYRVDLGGGVRRLALFPWERPTNDLFDYGISPDGSHLVFTAGNDPSEHEELYSALLDGSPAVQLSDPSGAYFALPRFEVTRDGRTVVYLQTDEEANGLEVAELYAVPVDRLADPVELNAGLPAGGEVLDFHIAPDGARVVYHADLGPGAGQQLFVETLPPSGHPLPLLQLPAFAVNVQRLELGPLGRRITFLADLERDDVLELYSRPTDGSAGPLKHSGQLVAGGSVRDYAFGRRGARAVYLADQERAGVLELFGVLGTRPPVKLSGGPNGGSAWSFELASDGRHVVYRTDQDQLGVFELYAAPSDGSAPAVKLSGALVAGGDVGAFRLAPDGEHVLYLADAAADEQFELFVAPVAGGAEPIRLNGALPAGGNVRADFVLSPDGRFVAYAADQCTDERFELFAVPIDRSAAPERRSGSMVAGGDVASSFWEQPFAFSLDSQRLLYIADQDEDDAFELYESLLGLDSSAGSPNLR